MTNLRNVEPFGRAKCLAIALLSLCASARPQGPGPGAQQGVDPGKKKEQPARVQAMRTALAGWDVGGLTHACVVYAIANRRGIPTWEQLLKPGHGKLRYVEVEVPKQDPWGKVYVLTEDPEHARKPFVYSFGPNRIDEKGGGDDINSNNWREATKALDAAIAPPVVAPRVLGKKGDIEVLKARMDVKSIHDACMMFMIKNRGKQPTWIDLIRPDEKGHAYIPGQAEPKRDPWKHDYVVTTDPEFPRKPFVYSFGPNGKNEQGRGDDISNRNYKTYKRPEPPAKAPLRPAKPGSNTAAQRSTTRGAIQSALEACRLYRIRHPGKIPTWAALTTPDANGFAYLDQKGPILDAWKRPLVLAGNGEEPEAPFVYSYGPNGIDEGGKGDDITSGDLPKDRRGR